MIDERGVKLAGSRIPLAHRRWLQSALREWQTDGILSADQVAQIQARYESDDEVGQRQQSLVVTTLLGMAALLFGAAVLLLIGFNWQALPREVKLIVSLAVVGATYAIGFWLRQRQGPSVVSNTVCFLGCLFYGAAIWLIAQAFHLEAHYPDGVWWWAIGILPVALLLDSLLIHLLFASLMALWAGMEVIAFQHLWLRLLFGGWSWPNGAYSLLPLAALGLVWAYRKGSPAAVGLYVALLSWWAVLQSFAWGLQQHSVFWIASVGAALLMLAEAHRRSDSMAVPYRVCGALLTAGALIPLSSGDFWGHMLDSVHRRVEGGRSAVVAEALGIVLLWIIAAVVLMVVRQRRRESESVGSYWRQLWFPTVIAATTALMALWSATVGNSAPGRVLPALVANLGMLGLSLYLVRVGVREERVRPFAAGIIYFLIWAFARYIDLFDFMGGMLGAAGLFALCGAGLIVVAKFWGRARAARLAAGAPLTAPIVWVGPAWFDRSVLWFKGRVQPLLILSAAAQIVLLVGMIVRESLPLWMGQTVMLRVIPVDPRDIFRGDYVILNYDLNRMGVGDAVTNRQTPRLQLDQSLYVSLEPDADGKHWHATRASATRPESGLFIRGRQTADYRQPVQYGIEAYYVQESTGLAWERLRNSKQLSAEVAIAPWGQAKLRRLVVED